VATAVGAALGLAAAGAVILELRRGLGAVEGPAVVAVPWALLAAIVAGCAALAASSAVLAAHHGRRAGAPRLVGGGA
jgi:hypothetical protein